MMLENNFSEGILLVNKSLKSTSFSLVRLLRKLTGIKKIGHAGTLDPLATGVMVMLIGKKYTRLSDSFLNKDKEYIAQIYLGKTTDTFDAEGQILTNSEIKPSLEDIEEALQHFQGTIEQLPPMFSAKKVQGRKLYDLARKGQEVERKKQKVFVSTNLLSYNYPIIELLITCSKGTYIRTIAHDLGEKLICGAYLSGLQRTRCGSFKLEECIDEDTLRTGKVDLKQWIKTQL